MKKVKILVLEGGKNEEHEVSIATGTQVKISLSNLGIEFDSLIVNPDTFREDILKFDNEYICFNALHGTFGEDGRIQKILDSLFFKYTHSNHETSFKAFNKELTKKEVEGSGVLTPDYLTVDYKDLDYKKINKFFSKFGPFVIKPISSGSSFGIKIFRKQKDIDVFFKNIDENSKIYINHNKLLVEKLIDGKELTVSVIEKNNLSFAVDVTEIISKNEYFDYQSKYTPGYSKHILPAILPDEIYNDCMSYAKIVHDKIHCKGISRADFIYNNENVYFLEINTQPGLTPISLLPEQLKYKGISFDELILNMINCAQ